MCRKLDVATGKVAVTSHTYTGGVEIEFTGNGGRRQINVCVNQTPGTNGSVILCGHVMEHDVRLPDLVARHRGRIITVTGEKAVLDQLGGPIGVGLCLMGKTSARYARHVFSGKVEVKLAGQEPVNLEICLNPKGITVCGAVKGTTTTFPVWFEQVRDQVVRFEGEPETLDHFGLKPIRARRSVTRLVPTK